LERQSAEGSRQSGAGKVPGNGAGGSGETVGGTRPSTFDLRLFNFLKNEATDLYENKGPALAKIGNEATGESSKQSAEGSRRGMHDGPVRRQRLRSSWGTTEA